ncbi:CoF synthetase [Cryobacterium tagatosivorans]|nr:CoF synthetase [Cryobacterium tagatosivorans]
MKPFIFLFVWLQDGVVRLLTRGITTHSLLLGPGIEPLRWTLGRWRAWRTFEMAARKVPAYREFLAQRGVSGKLSTKGGLAASYARLPEMDKRLDWEKYDIVAAFGGEGISENMRSHILRYAHSAFGSYGASDLEINVAIETDYTVELRRAIAQSPKLAKRITKQGEYGVLPMVFQFNPYDYLIETNEGGELIVSIVRKQNINPRLRYNIHDRGHVMRLRDLRPILEEHGLGRLNRLQFLDLPLLFHYGRSDMSVDYNGAVVAPDALRDVIYTDPVLLRAVANHRLVSFEDELGDKQLHIALQLTEGAGDGSGHDLAAWRASVVAALRRINGDFNNAILTSADATLPTIAFYPWRSGPFAGDGAKLKNEYVWHLTAADIPGANLDLSSRSAK